MATQLRKGDNAPNFSFSYTWTEREEVLDNLKDGYSKVLIFLRYHGCLICQLDIKRLIDEFNIFKQKNARVFVLIQSDKEVIRQKLNDDLPFEIICNPSLDIYQKYNVHKGTLLQFLHPSGLPKVIKSLALGNKHGKFEGEETQLPAIFTLSPEHKINFAYYGKHISDLPSWTVVADNL